MHGTLNWSSFIMLIRAYAYMCVHTFVIKIIISVCVCVIDIFIAFTFSCSYEENLCDAFFYRHVIVFTPFAATAMGLASICALALHQYCKRRMLLVSVMSEQDRANIQISESSRTN